MNLKERIDILSKLNQVLNHLVAQKEWASYEIGLTKAEYKALENSIVKAKIHNQWFTQESVLESFRGFTTWLNEKQLENWVKPYKFSSSPKTVAIIMAGNIPMVGFHDLISVFLSGHRALVKLSSSDNVLIPAVLHLMEKFNPKINDWIKLTEEKLDNFDAVIATGSDNSSLYFQSYFGKYPHIIRKNRTSVAVLTGEETKEDLKALGADIFTFYGLGCRNVSKLLVPEGYKFDKFFEAIFDFGDIIYHNKYANNYDYNKAVYLMNLVKILDNNFLILKEDEGLQSPLGVVFYQTYKTTDEIEHYLEVNKDKIQAIIGKDYIPFGQAQCPALTDYADGIDTMTFLQSL
ncbi:MAG TPA: acyl-CoA reductase [Crocinitomix sp.]|nr:acyl-CoA reductase [Crocinitomix sp.]